MTTQSLRPCVERLLRAGDHLRRCKREWVPIYRRLVAAECRRSGHSEQETAFLLRGLYTSAWPGVAEPVLVQKADRFAAWAYRQPGFSTTCQGIRNRAQHLCDGARANGRCEFAEKLVAEGNALRAKQKEQDRFEERWPEVLRQIHGNVGLVAARCFLAVRDKMARLGLTYGDTVFCSMREFQAAVGGEVSLGLVFQAVHLLTREHGHGLLEVVVKGRPGQPGEGERGSASGYRFVLPTPPPPGGRG